MELISLLKVIKLLLDAEYVFNLLLSPSFSLFWWLNCNLCNSLLCMTSAFLNAKKFATFLSFFQCYIHCSLLQILLPILSAAWFFQVPVNSEGHIHLLTGVLILSHKDFVSHKRPHRACNMDHSCSTCPESFLWLFLRRPAFSCSSWAITTHLPLAGGSPACTITECVSPPGLPLQLKLSSSLLFLGIILVAKHSCLLVMI